jgi:hypothetical protein
MTNRQKVLESMDIDSLKRERNILLRKRMKLEEEDRIYDHRDVQEDYMAEMDIMHIDALLDEGV